jgi:oligoribonuclease (3'-5' exoribonuclease)
MAQLGFDLNARRISDGCTPLHVAIASKKLRAAKALIALGADQSILNDQEEDCVGRYEMLASSMSNIIWIDCEFTAGFYDNAAARLLEVAVIITDKNLKELGRGQWVLGGFTRHELLALPPFHQAHFCDTTPGGPFPPPGGVTYGNGLFSDVLKSNLTREQVSAEIMKLLNIHCVPRSSPIGGNSVQCDREVLRAELPEVVRFINHRIVDVSTFIGMAERWNPEAVEAFKADQAAMANYNHRAMNDVEASIRGMQWIRDHLLVAQCGSHTTSTYSRAKLIALCTSVVVPCAVLCVHACISRLRFGNGTWKRP